MAVGICCEKDQKVAAHLDQITKRLENPPLGARRSWTRFVVFEKNAWRLRRQATTYEDRRSITDYQIELAVETWGDIFAQPLRLPRRSCRERNNSFVQLVKRVYKIG